MLFVKRVCGLTLALGGERKLTEPAFDRPFR
jgi:hypothetical protein